MSAKIFRYRKRGCTIQCLFLFFALILIPSLRVSVWRTFLTQILKVQIQEQMIFNCQYGFDFKLLWANATTEIENCIKCLTLFEVG